MENGEDAEILIDNDYCNRNIQLPYFPFSLDSIEEKIALEMIVNMQLAESYTEQRIIPALDAPQLPFYGNPNHVYYTERYVQLPNLEEFFFELVKEVRTIRINKQKKLKLVNYGEYQDLEPLILLDNIPVLSVDELLKIPLDRIEKIEIVDEPYIVTGSKFCGVICVSTRRKDFAGIDLNKNSRFFSYNLLSEGKFSTSDFSLSDTTKRTVRRNLLYWEPDLELNNDKTRSLSFYTSDSKGDYIVYIRNISSSGKTKLFGTCRIKVE
jgi:hypothetical protein